jgi:hypothetical protein
MKKVLDVLANSFASLGTMFLVLAVLAVPTQQARADDPCSDTNPCPDGYGCVEGTCMPSGSQGAAGKCVSDQTCNKINGFSTCWWSTSLSKCLTSGDTCSTMGSSTDCGGCSCQKYGTIDCTCQL